MKKLIVVVGISVPRLTLRVKRSFIAKNITTHLYDLYSAGEFEQYHAITQVALPALMSREAMRRAFIDGFTPVFMGSELMTEIDEAVQSGSEFDIIVTQDDGEELAVFSDKDLNY